MPRAVRIESSRIYENSNGFPVSGLNSHESGYKGTSDFAPTVCTKESRHASMASDVRLAIGSRSGA